MKKFKLFSGIPSVFWGGESTHMCQFYP